MRIHWHWTAGAPGINPKEADSYNYVITWPDGEVVPCIPVERQVPPLVNGAYAAHTLNANSNAIGIAVDAMALAAERPFSAGDYPITEKQVDALVKLTAELAIKHKIMVSRETILSHAEVQRTLGIKQKNKWDIMWLPGMDKPGDPIVIGDGLRARVGQEIEKILKPAPEPARPGKTPPIKKTAVKLNWADPVSAIIAGLIAIGGTLIAYLSGWLGG